MKTTSDQPINEKAQLLDLNEHCLMEIFQRLELLDFVNLALTCRHLRDVSNAVSVAKYKDILVCGLHADKKLSKQQFSNVISVIGEHVSEVEIRHPNHFVLESIRDNCKKLNSLKLWYCMTPTQLQDFCNLKELQLCDNYEVSNDEWRKIFANNADLEILRYNGDKYEAGFMELLATLPKLNSLELPWLSHYIHQSQDLEQLLRLDGLTKLSLRSYENCNEILIKVAAKLKLVELDIGLRFNADLLGIIKSFRHLEMLSMELWHRYEDDWLSDVTVFPPGLKRIKIEYFKMPCSKLMSIVNHLKFLDVFDLGFLGNIFLDQDRLIHLEDSKVIARIEDGLRRSRRTLKIIYRNWNIRDSLYTHKSSRLAFINDVFTVDQANLRRIYVA